MFRMQRANFPDWCVLAYVNDRGVVVETCQNHNAKLTGRSPRLTENILETYKAWKEKKPGKELPPHLMSDPVLDYNRWKEEKGVE